MPRVPPRARSGTSISEWIMHFETDSTRTRRGPRPAAPSAVRPRILVMPLTMSDVDRFEAARPRLGAIAYRLLGSASEAEDAVQETFLRWQAADVERVEVPEA